MEKSSSTAQKSITPRVIIIILAFVAGFIIVVFTMPSRRTVYLDKLTEESAAASANSSPPMTGSLFAPSGQPMPRKGEKNLAGLSKSDSDSINKALRDYQETVTKRVRVGADDREQSSDKMVPPPFPGGTTVAPTTPGVSAATQQQQTKTDETLDPSVALTSSPPTTAAAETTTTIDDDDTTRTLPPDVSHPDGTPRPMPPRRTRPRPRNGRWINGNWIPLQENETLPPETNPPPQTFLPPLSLPPVSSETLPPPRDGFAPFPIPNIDFGSTKLLVIEVGVNVNSDFWKIIQHDEDIFFMMFEPVTILSAHRSGCKGIEHRCLLVAAAASHFDGWVTFSMTGHTACGSAMSGGAKGTCAQGGAATVKVPTHRLDTILQQVPKQMPIYLSLDAQGMDFWAAQGITDKKDQVFGIIAECQSLSYRSPAHWLYYNNKTQKSCEEIKDCIETQWDGWAARGGNESMKKACTFNAGWPAEYNCHFDNLRHPLADIAKHFFHPLNSRDFRKLIFPQTCNVAHWNLRTPFE